MTGENDQPVLRLKDVVRTYGPVKALDGVSFEAHKGQFIALLGPNGAGKTTLFQLLSGLFTPDSGSIEVMGNDMRKNAVDRKSTRLNSSHVSESRMPSSA